MQGRRTAKFVAITATALMAMTACGSGGENSSSGAGGTLRYGVVIAPTSLAADSGVWANSAPFVQAVFDTLLHEDVDGSIQPWLATDWSYDDTKTVLTLTLREDVQFTDGEAFTADVAAQNLQRFKAGTSSDAGNLARISDISAVDPTTLQITLSEPDPGMLTYLAQSAGAMASPATFDDPDAATDPIGSGPFTINTDETVIGSTYVYEKNPDYWSDDAPAFDELVLTVYDNAQTELNAIQGGQVDAVNLLDTSALPQVEGAGFEAYPSEANWSGLVFFDRNGQLAPELSDVRVRQAINMAIDRDALVDAAPEGTATATTQIFPPGTPAFDADLDDRYPYDPEAARQLLADAGYPDGFTLRMPQVQLGSSTAYDLTKQYLGDIGITVEYDQLAVADIIPAVVSGQYASSVFILGGASVWQVATLQVTPDAPFNPFHSTDDTTAALLATIQSGTQEEADAASRELDEHIVEEAWFAPFNRPVGYFVATSDLDVELTSGAPVASLWHISPAG